MQEVSESEASIIGLGGEVTSTSDSTSTTSTTKKQVGQPKVKKDSIYCLVRDPEKVGDGMNAYVTYKVHTKGDNDKPIVSVRRYSDFLWLHDRLEEEFIDVIIPPVPEKAFVNNTSSDIVEYRRRELEKFLKRVLRHSSLSKSQYVKSFLTANEQDMVQHRTQKHVRPKIEEEQSNFFTSSLSFLTSVTQQVMSSVGKDDLVNLVKEVDLSFQESRHYFTDLHTQFAVLQGKADDDIAKTRSLVETLAEFSHSAELMSKCEASQDETLSGFWLKLSQILNQMSELQDALAKNETLILDNTLRDYVRITAAGKVCLNNRLDVLLKLQEAQKKKFKHSNCP